MNTAINQYNPKNDILNLGMLSYPISKVSIFLFLSFLSVTFYLSFFLGLNAYILLFSIVVLATPFFVLYPKLWIYGFAVMCFLFIRDADEGVSLSDFISGLYLVGSLHIWFIWKLVIQKESIIDNMYDWMFLFFHFSLVFNSIIALLNGVSFIDWLREYSVLSIVLFYFPCRYYLSDKNSMRKFLIILSVVTIATCFLQGYSYLKMMTNVVYAFQMGASIRIDQVVFSAGIFFGIILALSLKNILQKFFFFGFTILNVFALITTFSRTFWVLAIAIIGLIFLYINYSQKIRLVLYSFLTIIVLYFAMTTMFKDKTQILFGFMERRLQSTSKGTTDVSVQQRFNEYGKVNKAIEDYSLGGNGLAKEFFFFEKILGWTKFTTNIHNGYLYIIYRVGIFQIIFYFIPLLFYLIKSEFLTRKVKDSFYRPIVFGAFCTLIMMIISSFTSAQFFTREGIIVISVCFTIIGHTDRFHKSKESEIGNQA